MKKRLLAAAAALSILAAILIPSAVSAQTSPIVVEAENYTEAAGDGFWSYSAAHNELSAEFSGEGYIRTYGTSELTYKVNVPIAGEYKVIVYGAAPNESENKRDSFYVNGTEYYTYYLAGAPAWTASEIRNYADGAMTPASVMLQEGENTFRLDVHKWGAGGYIYYDKFELVYVEPPESETDALIAAINALPETLTPGEESTVADLRARYDALGETEKDLITNIDKLIAAEAVIAGLKNPAVIQPAQIDGGYSYSAAQGVLNGGAQAAAQGGRDGVLLGKSSALTQITIHVPETGNYRLYVSTLFTGGADFAGKVSVDEISGLYIANYTADTWAESIVGTEDYANGQLSPAPPENGFALTQGTHTVTVGNQWGAGYVENLILRPVVIQQDDVDAVRQLIAALPAGVTAANRDAVNVAFEAYRALSPQGKTELTDAEKEKVVAAKARIDAIAAGDSGAGALRYELEYAGLGGQAAVVEGGASEFAQYSGGGYVYLFEKPDSIKLDFYVPAAGNYRVYLISGSSQGDAKCEEVRINGGDVLYIATPAGTPKTWQTAQPGAENWIGGVLVPKAPETGFALKKGLNTLAIDVNWGYAAYDAVIVKPFEQVDESAVEAVINRISQIPASPSLADDARIQAAYAAYLALSDSEKAQVTNAVRLFTARAALRTLQSGGNFPAGTLRYEWEDARLNGSTSVVTEKTVFSNYSGGGYVFLFDSSMDLDVWVNQAGKYRIYIISGTTENNNKCDFISVNGGEKLLVSTPGGKTGVWQTSQPGTEYWTDNVLTPLTPAGGFALNAGRNTVALSANWGYAAYDSVLIVPYDSGEIGNPSTGESSILPAAAILFGALCAGFVLISAAAGGKAKARAAS